MISSPARAPVCEDAAAAPALERPDFRMTMGFTLDMARAALMNFLTLVRLRRIGTHHPL